MLRSRVVFGLAFAAAALNAGQVFYNIETAVGSEWIGDGRPAAAAILLKPQAVAFDKTGATYVSDSLDHRIRRIGTDGVIQTIAGTGKAGNSGDGGPARAAQLNSPY